MPTIDTIDSVPRGTESISMCQLSYVRFGVQQVSKHNQDLCLLLTKYTM